MKIKSILDFFINFAERQGIINDAFIVGGAVRDILVGNELKDIDIAIKGDAINIAHRFAREIDASFVVLDKEFGIVRVVKDNQYIDICLMRGHNIYNDLSERDITINAMAIPLRDTNNSQNLSLVTRYSLLNVIDPYNGKSDLVNGIIRMVSEENLIKDPLRLLRVYRFAATLDFSIEEKTINAVGKLASLINSVAVERIAEELRHIVSLDNSYKTMKALMDNRILVNIFPEVEEDFKVLGLELYKNVEDILNNPSRFLLPASYFSVHTFKKICLKLSTLFCNPDTAKQSAIRLKMSRKEVEFIHEIVLNRNKILNSYKEMQGMADETKLIGLLKEFRDDVYPLIILAIAQEPSITAFCKEIVSFYNNVFKPRAALLPIITGNDLINTFNLKPSPIFKKILIEIEDMTLEGSISSREEALKIAGEMLKNKLPLPS